MLTNWRFKAYAPGDTYRNSTADAFFDSDTVSDPGKALVREGIQNSLDANKIHTDKPALVRVSLIDQDAAPSWADVERYFGTAWPHYTTESCGLHPDDMSKTTRKLHGPRIRGHWHHGSGWRYRGVAWNRKKAKTTTSLTSSERKRLLTSPPATGAAGGSVRPPLSKPAE